VSVTLIINDFCYCNVSLSFNRIGRGGRFGRKGVAINFITDADRRALQELEQHYHTTIEEMPCNVADLI
jgi:translation initiation factor 4A